MFVLFIKKKTFKDCIIKSFEPVLIIKLEQIKLFYSNLK